MENISAYLDGESGEFERAQVRRELGRSTEARAAWEIYHRVGDALRGDLVLSSGFTDRVLARLEREPALIAPRRLSSSFGRYGLAAAASVAGVAVALSMAYKSEPVAAPQPALVAQVAQAEPRAAEFAPVAMAEARPNARQVNDLLRAHQEYATAGTIHQLGVYMQPVVALQTGGGEPR